MGIAIIRWWTAVFGGILLGAGLVLHAQVALAHHSREEVQNVFFLWRGIGRMTFIWQDDTTKMALAFNEIPESMLTESDRFAWTLAILGGLIALSSAFIHPRRAKAKGSK